MNRYAGGNECSPVTPRRGDDLEKLDKVIGVIGAGNMGEAFVGALIRSGMSAPDHIYINDISSVRLAAIKEMYGIVPAEDNQQVFSESDIIILAVKPQQLPDIVTDLVQSAAFSDNTRRKLIISIAAGIRIRKLEEILYATLPEGSRRNLPIIRVMPNTPALVLAGMSGMSGNSYAGAEDLFLARSILLSMGSVVEVKEAEMDAVTALSGSGPAYVFYFVEAMIEAGIALGFEPDTAAELTLKTVEGALRLLSERRESPADLRRKVTSPGGTTEAALTILTGNDVKGILIDAVKAAAQRSKELSR